MKAATSVSATRQATDAVDFSSSLYLGWRHASAALPDWSALTAGRPADLETDTLADSVARDGAALQGCEAALLWPSTLHACMDVLEVVSRSHTLIACRNLYPIMGWALERQKGRGQEVLLAAPQDDLAQLVLRCAPHRRPAVLVPAHDSLGQPLDWSSVLQALALRDGWLIIDHTQLFGLFGQRQAFLSAGQSAEGDWGLDGGGWLRHMQPLEPTLARRVLLIASWAKAFGAPLASVAGPAEWIQDLRLHGSSRVHCSPANRVAILAAQRALQLNARYGNKARAQLRYNIRLLRSYLTQCGLGSLNGDGVNVYHPMLRLGGLSAAQARHWEHRLRQANVHCVAVPGQTSGSGALVWLARADHDAQDFWLLHQALTQLIPSLRHQTFRKAAS
jgi:8-amino-7-oxononanoate synthase